MKDYNLYLSMKDIERYSDIDEFVYNELSTEKSIRINSIGDWDEGVFSVRVDILELEAIEVISNAIDDNILIGFDYLGGIDTINSLGLSTCSR